jgi:hypothetical protein
MVDYAEDANGGTWPKTGLWSVVFSLTLVIKWAKRKVDCSFELGVVVVVIARFLWRAAPWEFGYLLL